MVITIIIIFLKKAVGFAKGERQKSYVKNIRIIMVNITISIFLRKDADFVKTSIRKRQKNYVINIKIIMVNIIIITSLTMDADFVERTKKKRKALIRR